MRDYHAQTVEMSLIAREAIDDPQVHTVALDMKLQQHLSPGFGRPASTAPQGAASP